MTFKEFDQLKVGDVVGLSLDKLGIVDEIVFYKGTDHFRSINENGDVSYIYTDDVIFPEYTLSSLLEVSDVLNGIRNKIEDLEDIALILNRM